MLDQFSKMLEQKGRVRKGSGDLRTVLHFWRKNTEGNQEQPGGLSNVLKEILGPGDFAFYVHEATQGFWGFSQSVRDKIIEEYGSQWVMILLDGHHFYRAPLYSL